MVRYWQSVFSWAFTHAWQAFGQTSELILITIVGTILTTLLVFIFRRHTFKEHLVANILIVFSGTILTAVAIFLGYVVQAPLALQADAVRNQQALDTQVKPQCWSGNIILPGPRAIFPGAKSASEAVAYCNQERKAPLTITVNYDQEPIGAGQVTFADGRTVDAMESLKGKQVHIVVNSPSVLPYQAFIVTVYGGSDKPPLARNVVIESIDPER